MTGHDAVAHTDRSLPRADELPARIDESLARTHESLTRTGGPRTIAERLERALR